LTEVNRSRIEKDQYICIYECEYEISLVLGHLTERPEMHLFIVTAYASAPAG
jgi:hypothetical protein